MKRRDVLRLSTGTIAAVSVAHVAQAADDGMKKNHSLSKTVVTRLSRSYQIEYPLVCAGMAMVCDKAELGIAVAESGGIGAIAGSLLSPPVLANRIREMRKATEKPFHINFLTLFPHQAQIQVCIDNQVPIVSFHFGIPEPEIITRLQEADVAVWIQVGTVADAQKAHQAGADGIIVQGNEAGGHTYAGMPLLALVPAVRDLIKDKFLIAAGGIEDGKSAAAAFALGADAIMLGTRLVASDEANAHDDYKRRLKEANGEDTVITHVYGPEFPAFNPMRVIRNETIRKWENKIEDLPKERDKLESIGRTVFAGQEKDVKPFDSIIPVRETTGDFEQMPMLAGQGVGQVNSIEPAGQIVENIMHDAAEVLDEISTR